MKFSTFLKRHVFSTMAQRKTTLISISFSYPIITFLMEIFTYVVSEYYKGFKVDKNNLAVVVCQWNMKMHSKLFSLAYE